MFLLHKNRAGRVWQGAISLSPLTPIESGLLPLRELSRTLPKSLRALWKPLCEGSLRRSPLTPPDEAQPRSEGSIMARPRKDDGERRTERIAARLTPAERLHIETASREAGLQPSEYVRLQALKGRVVMRSTRSLDHATFDELRRIGVNLNQLTRLAHKNKSLPPQLPATLQALERVLARALDHTSPDDAALQGDFADAAEAENPAGHPGADADETPAPPAPPEWQP